MPVLGIDFEPQGSSSPFSPVHIRVVDAEWIGRIQYSTPGKAGVSQTISKVERDETNRGVDNQTIQEPWWAR